MILVKELIINAQYWFIFKGYKVFGRFLGNKGNIVKLGNAHIYYTESANESFNIEQYMFFDSTKLVNIKIDHSDIDENNSSHYLSEKFDR